MYIDKILVNKALTTQFRIVAQEEFKKEVWIIVKLDLTMIFTHNSHIPLNLSLRLYKKITNLRRLKSDKN
jgi:hypothetical protein